MAGRAIITRDQALGLIKENGNFVTTQDLEHARWFRDSILLTDGSKLFAIRQGAAWRYGIYTYGSISVEQALHTNSRYAQPSVEA